MTSKADETHELPLTRARYASDETKASPSVFDPETQSFKCLACGAVDRPRLPSPLHLFVAMCGEFADLHRHCGRVPFPFSARTH